MKNAEKCIEVCNELLRGELTAVETYHQAIDRFDSVEERQALEEIMHDHSRSADALRSHVVSMGGKPSEGSGAWGGVVQALEGATKLFGETSLLKLLVTGEKHGIGEYQNALDEEDVMNEIKIQISHDMLPRLSQHIQRLRRIAA